MINTDFKIERGIRQKKLSILLQDEKLNYSNGGNIKSCEFDLDKKYHAVKIKYVDRNSSISDETYYTRKRIQKLEGELTIAVFNTGSIIITGAKKSPEIISAYKFIIDFLSKNSENLLKNTITNKKKKRKVYLKKREIRELNSLLQTKINENTIQ